MAARWPWRGRRARWGLALAVDALAVTGAGAGRALDVVGWALDVVGQAPDVAGAGCGAGRWETVDMPGRCAGRGWRWPWRDGAGRTLALAVWGGRWTWLGGRRT